MNIALFGGSFNPIHNGHIKLIKAIADSFDIHKFIIMPTAISPHKSNSEMVSDVYRYEMCKLACEKLQSVEVSDWEIYQKGKSFTYLTVNYLTTIYPNDKLFLVIGADMFISFEQWRNFSDILKKVCLIAVPRDNIKYDDMIKYAKIFEKYGTRCYILKDSVMNVSSSEIRLKIRNKIDVSDLLDRKVLRYIEENRLYECDLIE